MTGWFIVVSGLVLFIIPATSLGADPAPSVPLPAETINQILSFIFAGAGLLAFGAIVYGAVQYTFAAGNSSLQSDAKDRIWQALVGLLLLVSSFLILKTINPQLVNNPSISVLSPGPGTTTSSICKEPCTTGECLPGGFCRVCSLNCGPDAGCVFDEGGNPSCKACPVAVLQQCASGEVCKFQNNRPYCAPKRCGDNNKSGPCPNKDEECVPFPGLTSQDRLWGCVKSPNGAPR